MSLLYYLKNIFSKLKKETTDERWNRLSEDARNTEFTLLEKEWCIEKVSKWDRVIVKSNEPEEYDTWIITGFAPRGLYSVQESLIPIVKCDSNGEEFLILWPTTKYTVELEEILKKLKPMEQYIYLIKWNPWGIANCKVKKGVYYESKGYKQNGCRTYKQICKELWLTYEHIDFGEWMTN